MLRYAARRFLLTFPTLLVVSLVVFVLMRIVPGDPAILLVGELPSPEALARVREKLALDEPYAVQYWIWLKDILRLDFGRSLLTGEPVLEAMLRRFGVTAQVVFLATGLAALLGVPAGMIAAWRQDRLSDLALVTAAVFCLSVPSFWAGLMLILLFGVQLRWLPTVGYVSVAEDPLRGLSYLALPVVSLVFVEVGSVLRMTRGSTIEVLRSEYVTHARAKGLSEGAVLARHAFKNAVAPTLTILGVIFGTLLGGAAVIETVFTLPGLGRLLVDSIYSRDYPVVQGIVLLVACCYVFVNLVVDLIYPALDPRVRL
jgi:peptide/nickel transport system permease protein